MEGMKIFAKTHGAVTFTMQGKTLYLRLGFCEGGK